MKWNTTHIDHLKRKALGLTQIQYIVLDFLYWMSNWRNNSVNGYCKLSMSAIAEHLCLSKDTVRTVISSLEEKDLIKMAYAFEVEDMIDTGFEIKDSERESLRRVTSRVETIFDMDRDELLKQVPRMEKSWRFTDVNYHVLRAVAKSGLRLKLSHYCFLDYIRQSQSSDSFGELGWCNLSIPVMARVMDMTEDGVRKMVKKVEPFLVFDQGKGCRVSDIFNKFFLEGVESDTTKRESVKKAAARDTVINSEVYDEVMWRLDNTFSANQLREIFGEDADLVAEKNYLTEQWIESGEKELVPHPKRAKGNDYKYQNCLRGFKRWVETYAKNRSSVPVEDRKLVTSHKAKEIEKELIRKTAIAYGRAVSDYWREKDWSLNEQSLDKFCRQNFSVDEKRKYLIYVAINFPKDYQFDLNKVMDEFVKKSVLDDALNEWDLKEHSGRPREYDRMPPVYSAKRMPPGCNTSNWRAKMPKDYYKEFDSIHKPVYWYNRNGDKIN